MNRNNNVKQAVLPRKVAKSHRSGRHPPTREEVAAQAGHRDDEALQPHPRLIERDPNGTGIESRTGQPGLGRCQVTEGASSRSGVGTHHAIQNHVLFVRIALYQAKKASMTWP